MAEYVVLAQTFSLGGSRIRCPGGELRSPPGVRFGDEISLIILEVDDLKTSDDGVVAGN